MTKLVNTRMCEVYTRTWEDTKTIGIYGRFLKGKKRYFVRLLQSFPEYEKRLDLYVKFWNSKMGLTYDEIGFVMAGIRQQNDLKEYRRDEFEEKGCLHPNGGCCVCEYNSVCDID
jgi:hypothetical protein